MTTRSSKPPEVTRQTVFNAIAVTLQSLAKARGQLVEAQQTDQLRDVARELGRAKEQAAQAYDAACRFYHRSSGAGDRIP